MKIKNRVLLLILFIGISVSTVLASSTLTAVLIIADDYEDQEMNNISESVKRDLGTVGSFLNVLDKRNLYKVNKIVLKGQDATKQKVQSTLNGLSLSNEDILMVYFSGHGGMDSRGTFIVTREGSFYYRSELESYVKNKNARLKILITDACSNDIEGIAAARSFRTSRSSLEGKFDDVYKKLFSNYEGFMNLSASSEGEYAWSDDNYGGYFTYYFIKEGLTKGPTENWNDIFNSSKQKVVQMFNRMPADQRNELREEGINSQTPKAYSLPVGKNGTSLPPSNPVPDTHAPSYSTPQAQSASISISNNTEYSINYFVEVMATDGETVVEETEDWLSSEQSLSLSYVSIFYFNNGSEEIGYEIGSGNYVFKPTKNGEVDLFPMEESYEDYYEPYSASDLSMLLIGEWEYELDGDYVYFGFYDDGTYEIYDEEDFVLIEGEWNLYDEDIEGEVYYTLELLDDEGYLYEYDFYTEDGYMIELLSLIDDDSEVEFLYATE